jgi:hypothetical protein
MHPDLHLDKPPPLRTPAMILAWGGWSDAGSSATHGLRALANAIDAQSCGSIDPENYYDFSVTRPFARYREGEREIVWPSTDFYYGAPTDAHRDLGIAIGYEPANRWKSYMDALFDGVSAFGAELVISLAAVAAPVPHTRDVVVWGSANTAELAEQHNMHPPAYEGPTGIAGIFHDYCRRKEIGAISLWASVPHYLGDATNPAGSLALLERLQEILDLPLPLAALREEIPPFHEQVDRVIASDEDLASYITRLESSTSLPAPSPAPGPPPTELPPAETIIEDLEHFLRGAQQDGPTQGEGGPRGG